MRAGWLAALAVAAPIALAAAPATDDAAAVRWLRATGHPLVAPEPTPAELAPLVARLNGARVIGIGEATHGTHEDQAFKVALIKELVKARAIDTVVLEANRAVGTGFDGYVRHGTGDPTALLLSPASFGMIRNEEFAGLLIWLRAWNLAHPERMVGVIAIDDQDGAADAAFALDFVARRDPALAARLRSGFGSLLPGPGQPWVRVSDWIGQRDAAAVAPVLAAAAALRDSFAANAAAWRADPDYDEADYAARMAWQNVHVFERDVKGADLKNLPVDYMNRRDCYMSANLLARLGARRGVLWAHNDHVRHTMPASWASEGYLSQGTLLRAALGPAYRTVGFTYGRADVVAARIDRSMTDIAARVAPRRDTVIAVDNTGPRTSGAVLTLLPGPAWWFDMAAAGREQPAVTRWLARGLWLGEAGWGFNPATFQTTDPATDSAPFGMGFDVMVWLARQTPQRRLIRGDEVAGTSPRP